MGADPPPATAADPAAKPAWASAMGKDQYGTWADLTVKGVRQRMRLIPAGTFKMGSPENDKWHDVNGEHSETLHDVTITHDYWIGDSTCTQSLWIAIMGNNPSTRHGDPLLPVETISWNDCHDFIDRFNKVIGSAHIRFPTESEWEYACRAGTTGLYGGESLADMGWFMDTESIEYSTHPVKSKKPNLWGIYDMHGNVLQWCSDWYADYEEKATIDPMGPISGVERVLRGGCSMSRAEKCRSADRGANPPAEKSQWYGFRLCISAQPGTSP